MYVYTQTIWSDAYHCLHNSAMITSSSCIGLVVIINVIIHHDKVTSADFFFFAIFDPDFTIHGSAN